jgi:hypothetical protein
MRHFRLSTYHHLLRNIEKTKYTIRYCRVATDLTKTDGRPTGPIERIREAGLLLGELLWEHALLPL